MARYSQPSFDFYQQPTSTLETKSSYPEEDEMSVLDDKILDSTSPELSSIPDHRRTSYDHAPEAFSHRDSVWSEFSHPVSSNQSRHNSQVGHGLYDSNPTFMPVDGVHPASAYGHHAPWSLSRDSGSCTPTAMYEQFHPDLEHSSSAPFSGGAVGPVSAINIASMSYRPGMTFAPPGAIAMSPQSSQGWMPASTDMPDAMSRPTKSPTYRNSSPLSIRRDGIRKKNARFEIPAERTLSNIDHLISQSTNEEEIKELKQQKRLLRNRQAALDSRQRKKLHTEKLEEEKKHFTQMINDLEEALQNMKLRESELLREKSEWIAAQQQINQYIEGLHMDKDEVIRVHTLETAELRKKNNILKETVEKLERQVKSSAASNLSTDFSDFESLTMDNSWEDFTMTNGLPLDPESAPASSMQSSAMVLPTNDRAAEKNAATADYPFSWNAFYMCLLVGAFIASNNSALSARAIPQLSEDYRNESANVLKAVLAASPPELAQMTNQPVVASASAGPMPTTITGSEMAQMTSGAAHPSNLDELHNTLAMPTKEQEQEQVFSLNAEQYNALTTFDETNVDYKSQPSNLQQALAAMRNNAAQNKLPNKASSDVYTRSLMWDRVPEKVIRDFQRMVQEYGASPVKEEQSGFAQS
ncbi:putative bZIP transcription factor [Aspergillus clavatus NRRL 1]|uniref:BZIP transcription factor, putative n=1 Tax=Aspergillus clavatus (strain ATCC 1007 / CBS 513.65 / DSM 816 / NCTC 3887 / NRRL 1 / QM 1276 / 107) TaxID=344612 RepID=A1C486_ASPCL|nr:bZIP transcription factor, putative [Aspergillus clavatus NRRL 1]EAW15226.1 bZIP transcription factor, putative [Aspergillus clavatus NRRL 1]